MNTPENRNYIKEQIGVLNQQYEEALRKGKEFSILREIREKLRELKKMLGEDGQEDGHASL